LRFLIAAGFIGKFNIAARNSEKKNSFTVFERKMPKLTLY